MFSRKTPFDRTNDFAKAVEAAKAEAERQGKIKNLKPMTKAELSEFAEEAASIGRAIQLTTQKLKLFADGIYFAFQFHFLWEEKALSFLYFPPFHFKASYKLYIFSLLQTLSQCF